MTESAAPIEELKATEADKSVPDDEEPKGWPHEPIQDIPEADRDALLQSGGPTGEMARLAWDEYRKTQGEAVASAPTAPSPATTEEAPQDPEQEAYVPMGASTSAAPAEGDTGAPSERQEAEAKAAERGLEIRDYGTAGEWRVYDTATGKQVAKSRLDAPV